jgi:hypothetical protein
MCTLVDHSLFIVRWDDNTHQDIIGNWQRKTFADCWLGSCNPQQPMCNAEPQDERADNDNT